MKNLVAFTLAEILIVLGVIGIVAEMTIPTLVATSQEAQMVAGFLKFHSNLAQAIQLWKNETGCQSPAYVCLAQQDSGVDDYGPYFDKFMNTIGKQMKIISSAGNSAENIAWLPNDTLNYYGESSGDWAGGKVANNTSHMAGMFLLADGTTLAVAGSVDSFGIWVDVNGKKPPNRIGKDTFRLMVGSAPFGDYVRNDISYCRASGDGTGNDAGLCSCWDTCDPNNADPDSTESDGVMPAAYVLLNKKLPSY